MVDHDSRDTHSANGVNHLHFSRHTIARSPRPFPSAPCSLCDGALVIVDAVEGVCIQTHAVLRTAWAEGVRPVLVINKLDRLIVELQLSPGEAYGHLCRILEQANVILSELYMADLMAAQAATTAAAVAAGGAGDAIMDGATSHAEAAAKAAAAAAAASGTGGDEGEELTAGGASGDAAATFDATGVDVDEKAEAALFFDPTKGNVIFASAADGWAFTLDDFAGLACGKLELPRALARRALWGDFYFKPKARKVVRGAQGVGVKPLAVSLVWERLWAVYEAVQTTPDEARAGKIIAALALDVPKRDLAVKDARMRLQAVMRAWLPVAPTVLGVVARKLPSPVEAQASRVSRLWPALHASLGDATPDTPSPALSAGMSLEQRLARVRRGIAECDPSPSAECVVYISKMFSVPHASLPDLDATFATPGLASNPLGSSDAPLPGAAAFPTSIGSTPEGAWWGMGELEQPGARGSLDLSPVNSSSQRSRALHRKQAQRKGEVAEEGAAHDEDGNGDDEDAEGDGTETLIAFARVFSGVLRPDSPVFVLGPKYSPLAPSAGDCAHVSQVASPMPLYMMMGRELSPLLEARAGNVIGIGRLASHVLKTATLASTPACPSLSPMTFQTTPLVRVAIEPKDPRHMRAVERGLALLNASDPCVELSVADNGELQLAALGELHLDRCVKDLVTRFARCDVSVSPPIMSFQETLTEAPKPVQPPAQVLAALGPGGTGVPAGAAAAAAAGAALQLLATPTAASSTTSGSAASRSFFPSDGHGHGHGRDGAVEEDAQAAAQSTVSLTAGFEFGRVYGGGHLPWSWSLPESGIAFHPPSASVVAHTPDRSVSLRLRAVPMPPAVTRFLLDSAPTIKALAAEQKRLATSGGAAAAASRAASSPAALVFIARLRELCVEAGGPWLKYASRVWSLGPRRTGPNMLVGPASATVAARLAASLDIEPSAVTSALSSLWASIGLGHLMPQEESSAVDGSSAAAGGAGSGAQGALTALRSSIVQGFQLASGGGPLCGEPMWGVAFLVEEVEVRRGSTTAAAATAAVGEAAPSPAASSAVDALSESLAAASLGADGELPQAQGTPTSSAAPSAGLSASGGAVVPAGAVMAVTRDACRVAFQAGTQRLVEAVFKCELQCSGGRGGGGTGEQLGRLYGVLARRRGRVVSEDVREGTQTFEISALLPVVESFGFADDLRKQTSGAATSPQLVFSHWEVLEQDPLQRAPTTEEEREEFGETLHEGQGGRNLARGYVDAVRGRKGMPVERKIVAHAEKQRTLSRKK